MPRLDGRLYEFEKTALKPKLEPKKPEPKKPEPPKPRPKVPHPLAPKQEELNRLGKVKITPEVVEKVLQGIRDGLNVERSLVLVGVSQVGMDRWRKRNPALNEKFARAEAEWEKTMVLSISGKAPSDWKAGAWLLERRMAQRWAQVTKSELTGKDGGPIQQTTLSKQLLASVGGKGDGYATERKRKGPLPAAATEHGIANQVIDVTAKVVAQHDAKHDASPDVAT